MPAGRSELSREWASRGSTIVPPADLITSPPSATTLVNAASGVSDAEAREQLDALQRAARWETWGIEHDQPQLLLNFIAAPEIFADVLTALEEARDHAGNVSLSQPLTITRADLFTLADYDEEYLARHGGVPSATAWRATYRGPVVLTVRWADVTRRVPIIDRDDMQFAEGGTVHMDPLLGLVWRWGFRFDCLGAGRAMTICAT